MVSEKIVQHDIMSQPPRRNRGRPPGKRGHKKNIAGLRNQPAAPSPVEERIVATHPFDSDEDPDDESSWDPHSGLKPSLFDDEASDKDCDCEEELSEDENMEVQESLTRMLQELRDEDPRDKDWLPYCESRRRDRRKPAGE